MIQALYITWFKKNNPDLSPLCDFPLNPGQTIAYLRMDNEFSDDLCFHMKIDGITRLTQEQYKYLEQPGVISSVELYI